jgi:hypothetical protein
MMFDAAWTASLAPLKTRREVRSFLARALNDLIGGEAQPDSSQELADLATGSDREVIDSYRFLEALCAGLTAREAKYPSVLVSLNVRDLFAKALQRMKELSPDPRETLHAKPANTLDVEPPEQTNTTGRSASRPVPLRQRSAHIHVKPAEAPHSPQVKL